MAKVIKQGRCSFSVLPAESLAAAGSQAETDGDDFNSLSCLIPQPEQAELAAGSDDDVETDCPSDPLEEAHRQAQAIVEQAREEARRIEEEARRVVAEAKRNAEEIESQAYTLGYEQGHKDGEELGRKQFEVALQHLERLLTNFKEQTASLSSAYEAQMVHVCMMVAKAVVEKEIATDRELISRVLVRAFDKTVEGSTVTVHLNPRDFENLDQETLSALSGPGGNRIEFRQDPKVSRGGCTIETDFGLVDASVESRWQCVVEEIGRQLFERSGAELSGSVKKIDIPEDEP